MTVNSSLQRRTETVSGMQAAVCEVQSTLNGKRSHKAFQSLFDEGIYSCEFFRLRTYNNCKSSTTIQVLWWRKKMVSVLKLLEHYRVEFYKILDTIDAQFTERFQQGGLLTLQKLENTLLSGNTQL